MSSLCRSRTAAYRYCTQFNFNEAVNFALPEWLPLGLSCVQQYRNYHKHPVFSHDELLITVHQHSDSIRTALWYVHLLALLSFMRR